MTENELIQLRFRKAHLKIKCENIYKIVKSLRKALDDYTKLHEKLCNQFEEVDRKIAMETKRTITPLNSKKEKKQDIKMSKDEMQELLEELEKLL